MSCLCIGGVCIPYTAVLPLLLIGLQWVATQLAKVGLLPDWVAKKLGKLHVVLSSSPVFRCDRHVDTLIS